MEDVVFGRGCRSIASVVFVRRRKAEVRVPRVGWRGLVPR